jgi:hypothetical protein
MLFEHQAVLSVVFGMATASWFVVSPQLAVELHKAAPTARPRCLWICMQSIDVPKCSSSYCTVLVGVCLYLSVRCSLKQHGCKISVVRVAAVPTQCFRTSCWCLLFTCDWNLFPLLLFEMTEEGEILAEAAKQAKVAAWVGQLQMVDSQCVREYQFLAPVAEVLIHHNYMSIPDLQGAVMEDFVEIDSMISGSHKTFFRRLLTYVNPPVVAAAAPTAGDAIVALQSAMGVVHAPRRPSRLSMCSRD